MTDEGYMFDFLRKKELLKARGITWYIVISPIPKEDELEHIRNLILSHYLFQNDFKGAYLELHDKISDTSNWIKIRSPIFSNRMLKTSEIHSYYNHVYDELYEYIKDCFNKNNFKLLGFSFEINHQIFPEEPKGIICVPQNLNLSFKKMDEE